MLSHLRPTLAYQAQRHLGGLEIGVDDSTGDWQWARTCTFNGYTMTTVRFPLRSFTEAPPHLLLIYCLSLLPHLVLPCQISPGQCLAPVWLSEEQFMLRYPIASTTFGKHRDAGEL